MADAVWTRAGGAGSGVIIIREHVSAGGRRRAVPPTLLSAAVRLADSDLCVIRPMQHRRSRFTDWAIAWPSLLDDGVGSRHCVAVGRTKIGRSVSLQRSALGATRLMPTGAGVAKATVSARSRCAATHGFIEAHRDTGVARFTVRFRWRGQICIRRTSLAAFVLSVR